MLYYVGLVGVKLKKKEREREVLRNSITLSDASLTCKTICTQWCLRLNTDDAVAEECVRIDGLYAQLRRLIRSGMVQ